MKEGRVQSCWQESDLIAETTGHVSRVDEVIKDPTPMGMLSVTLLKHVQPHTHITHAQPHTHIHTSHMYTHTHITHTQPHTHIHTTHNSFCYKTGSGSYRSIQTSVWDHTHLSEQSYSLQTQEVWVHCNDCCHGNRSMAITPI